MAEKETSSSPGHGDTPATAPTVVGENAGDRALPRDGDAWARRWLARPGAGGDNGAPGGENLGGEHRPAEPDPLIDRLCSRLAASPFDGVAAFTGKDYWLVPDEDRKLLGDEVKNLAQCHGVVLDKRSHPLVRVGLAYAAVASGPLWALALELRAFRVEQAKQRGG